MITGASGLLGRALVKEFLEREWFVFAQYHTRQPEEHANCQSLWADFSNLEGIREFLHRNRELIKDCSYLINNYGPITSKPFAQVTAEDFTFDFHHNVVTAFEITGFMIKNAPLQAVVNIGFEFLGQDRAYKKILAYAAAKNALLLLTRSLAREHPGIRFHIIPLPTLRGAQVKAENGIPLPPEQAAKDIYTLLIEQEI